MDSIRIHAKRVFIYFGCDKVYFLLMSCSHNQQNQALNSWSFDGGDHLSLDSLSRLLFSCITGELLLTFYITHLFHEEHQCSTRFSHHRRCHQESFEYHCLLQSGRFLSLSWNWNCMSAADSLEVVGVFAWDYCCQKPFKVDCFYSAEISSTESFLLLYQIRIWCRRWCSWIVGRFNSFLFHPWWYLAAVTGKTNDSTGELKIKSIINILKSHFQHQLADIGPTVDEWAKLLTSKSTDVKLWTDQLTSFHHSSPDPNLQELPSLITIHDRLLRLKDSILTQSSIFLRMIESLQPLCDPLCPQSDIPYTALVPEFESDMQDVDLKYLITLLVNEINDWICTSVFDFLSPEIFDGHSFSHLERMMTIGDDSLTRLAVAQRLNSNIRYG